MKRDVSPAHCRAILACLILLGGPVVAQERGPSFSPKAWLATHCIDCHGPDSQEADLRLDTLDVTTPSVQVGETLERVLAAVASSKMPPEEAEAVPPSEREQFVSWLDGTLDHMATQLRPRSRRGNNRRLTTEEYNHTMQRLFGVDAQFADMLPPDPISTSGFRNDNGLLGLSSLRVEAYLDSARRAVARYTRNEEARQRLRYSIAFDELYYATGDRYGTYKRAPTPLDPLAFNGARDRAGRTPPQFIEPLGPKKPGAFSTAESLRPALPKLHQQYVAVRERLPVGELLVRIRAAGTADRHGRFPRMRVEAGITLGDGCSIDKRSLGEVDVRAPREHPQTYSFRIRLEDVPTKGPRSEDASFDRLSVFDLDQIFIENVTPDARAIFALGRGGYKSPEEGARRIAKHVETLKQQQACLLYLAGIEIEMISGVGKSGAAYRWRMPQAVDGEIPPAAASAFLRRFVTAAYRRPVSDQEIATKRALWQQLRQRGLSTEESLQEVMAATLVSPAFLFRESSSPPDSAPIAPHRLAARLSYLLWLGPPDQTLRRLADDAALLEPDVLRRETARMLADPRVERFTHSFCQQWLRLDKADLIAIDRQKHPTYDEDLAEAALAETLALFHDNFRQRRSALELLASRTTFLNDRLAEHYGLPGPRTGALQRVDLPQGSVRGGLLTQASLLMMNSDGAESHPIRRGVWLLDRLLHDPPPPPPPNVPALEDSVPSGTELSVREQIARHREAEGCRGCHAKIDPWGLALEPFDATGRWREVANAVATLPDGTNVNSIEEFKRYLQSHQRDRFARALVHHMLTYALGRPPDFLDRVLVKQILARFEASGYQLAELVLAVVESPLFREP